MLTVNGVSVTSGSNQLTDVISGVEVDISKLGSATISLTKDSGAIANSLQSFVDAYNQVKSAVDSARNGSMSGNASVLSVQQQLVSVLQTPVAGADPVNSYAYLSQVGISIQKDGTLKLDQTAFNTALNNNPSAVTNLFGNSSNTGFADRFNATINSLLGPDGIVQTSTSSINSRISLENNLQTSLNSKLAALKAQYTQQYTTLNATLAQMQQATTNLAGLLSSSSS
ncbi:flagellar filament capping protein FliD [Paludibacterium denitrificans]|uniref:flagellar filament capping protein FliD n=1 Tax=Paludibacterium denitrificans TaxID=2675226 RepID=UPI001E32E732|nr:flagellar filament capping protein FliD [Paludibacterium denitrificans]